MRLPATKVYRAFPELDRFSQEQCDRFLRAATRGVWRSFGRFALQTLGALVVLFVVGVAVVWGGRLAHIGPLTLRADWAWTLLGALGLLAVLGAAGLAWLVMKDWLVRRRIRWVINTRGSCMACGYVLTGLPVGTDLGVVCPECGSRLPVEANLGEVVEVEPGVRRFMPSPDAVPPLLRWLTPRRKKRLVRLAIGVPLALVLILMIGWGGYEWFLIRQAVAARAAMVGAAGLAEFVEKHQPAGTDPNAPNAWTAFYAADDLISQADANALRARYSGRVGSGPLSLDFFEIYAAPGAEENPEEADRRAAVRELAREMIDAYRRDGVYARFDEMGACRRAMRPIVAPAPGSPYITAWVPEFVRVQRLAQINAARMKLAADGGDLPEFAAAMEANLALERMCRHGPLLNDRLVGGSIQAVTFERIRAVLAAQPGVPWVEAVLAAVERQRESVPFEVALEGEKLRALDEVARVFSDPSLVRAGRYSPALRQLWGATPGAVGTYAENRDAIAALFDRMIAEVRLEPWQRPGSAVVAASDLLLVANSEYSHGYALPGADQERAHERALAVLLALERFRCERGSYPDSLGELVPRFLAAVPVDPWSGTALVYRRLETRADGRAAYLLYGVGQDGINDGGRRSDAGRWSDPLSDTRTGIDFVISPDWEDVPAGNQRK